MRWPSELLMRAMLRQRAKIRAADEACVDERCLYVEDVMPMRERDESDTRWR